MPTEEVKVATAQKTEVKPVPEKQTHCPACNKPITKLKRYYRDGKFYCNKDCWRKIAKVKPEQNEDAKS